MATWNGPQQDRRAAFGALKELVRDWEGDVHAVSEAVQPELRPFIVWMRNRAGDDMFLTGAWDWTEAIRMAKAGAIASGWVTVVQDCRSFV